MLAESELIAEIHSIYASLASFYASKKEHQRWSWARNNLMQESCATRSFSIANCPRGVAERFYLRTEDSRATSDGSRTIDRGRVGGVFSSSVDIIRAARSPISPAC